MHKEENGCKFEFINLRLQLNSGGTGVEMRMKERRIGEGIHVNQLVR